LEIDNLINIMFPAIEPGPIKKAHLIRNWPEVPVRRPVIRGLWEICSAVHGAGDDDTERFSKQRIRVASKAPAAASDTERNHGRCSMPAFFKYSDL
jgi:hypothetical protein